jgi:hypothetical protein
MCSGLESHVHEPSEHGGGGAWLDLQMGCLFLLPAAALAHGHACTFEGCGYPIIMMLSVMLS